MTMLAAVPERPAVSRPLMVALGDSATAGVGDAPADGGWSAHLAGVIGADLCNLGRNGARARDVAAEQLPQALRLRPDLATVFVGGNDVLRGDFDPVDVRDGVQAAAHALTTAGTSVVVVIPPRVGPELPAPQIVRRVLTRRMDLVRDVLLSAVQSMSADGRSLALIDAQQLRDDCGPAIFHIDRIHPSPLGHRLLAALVAAHLSAVGWPATGTMSQVPVPPHLALRVGWLVLRGVPWFVRRSRDLLPELARVVVREELLQRRVSERPVRMPEPGPRASR